MTTETKPPKRKYGLSRQHTRRAARDFLDFDYIEKLAATDPAALEWLERFAREYYQSRFTNTDKDLHNTKELKRREYGENNARVRDMWNNFYRVPGDGALIQDDDEGEDGDK